jgi:hypothetical protein
MHTYLRDHYKREMTEIRILPGRCLARPLQFPCAQLQSLRELHSPSAEHAWTEWSFLHQLISLCCAFVVPLKGISKWFLPNCVISFFFLTEASINVFHIIDCVSMEACIHTYHYAINIGLWIHSYIYVSIHGFTRTTHTHHTRWLYSVIKTIIPRNVRDSVITL